MSGVATARDDINYRVPAKGNKWMEQGGFAAILHDKMGSKRGFGESKKQVRDSWQYAKLHAWIA